MSKTFTGMSTRLELTRKSTLGILALSFREGPDLNRGSIDTGVSWLPAAALISNNLPPKTSRADAATAVRAREGMCYLSASRQESLPNCDMIFDQAETRSTGLLMLNSRPRQYRTADPIRSRHGSEPGMGRCVR